MFATWSFAEVAFAVQELLGITPVESKVAGAPARGKKKRTYEIYGRLYDLTEREYEAYLAQRKKYLKRVEKAVADNITEYTNNKPVATLKDLVGDFTFRPKTLDIPFVEQLDNIFSEALAILAKQQQEKRRLQDAEDEIAIQSLLEYGFIF